MTVIISADQARRLNPILKCKTVIDRLDGMIREAAACGAFEIRVPDELVEISGYSVSFITPGVHQVLIAAGYRITSRSDSSQPREVWLDVSWRAFE